MVLAADLKTPVSVSLLNVIPGAEDEPEVNCITPVNVAPLKGVRPKLVVVKLPTVTYPSFAPLRIFSRLFAVSAYH
jgi:hypothetical protein